MKNNDPPVKYLTFVGNYQSAENLLQAMDQQSWHPDFIDFDSVVYSPLFLEDLEERGITTTNVFWFINSGMFEEASGNPEMQLYERMAAAQWAAGPRTSSGSTRGRRGDCSRRSPPSSGPNLTRKAFLAEIAKVQEWDSHGLHAAHLTGQKLTGPATCTGTSRTTPSSGWRPPAAGRCNNPTPEPCPIRLPTRTPDRGGRMEQAHHLHGPRDRHGCDLRGGGERSRRHLRDLRASSTSPTARSACSARSSTGSCTSR